MTIRLLSHARLHARLRAPPVCLLLLDCSSRSSGYCSMTTEWLHAVTHGRDRVQKPAATLLHSMQLAVVSSAPHSRPSAGLLTTELAGRFPHSSMTAPTSPCTTSTVQ
jgi:hypothetical protein